MKKYEDLTSGEKEEIKITVCASCYTAACWHGEFYCDKYEHSYIVAIPIYYLEQYNAEHHDYWGNDIQTHFEMLALEDRQTAQLFELTGI